jgi:flagellar basal-body rod modification protein FlgD
MTREKGRRFNRMHVTNAVSMIPRDSTMATSGSTSSTQSSTSASDNELSESSFMTLLTAELQAQDPTNPMDPTTFVSQLIQLSQLQSTAQIQQSVSQIASSLTPSSSTGGASS